jgi:hypothetical protein
VPIRFVAAIFGVNDQKAAIRRLIALMVLCCDPRAIALTAAARRGRRAVYRFGWVKQRLIR